MGLYSCGSKMAAKTAAKGGKDAKGKGKDKGPIKKVDPLKKSKTKAKKKSWTKVKVKDKLNNEVFLDEKRWAKMQQEIPKILQITRATLCDKYKVNGSVARAIIKSLSSAGSIKRVGDPCASFDLYTGVQAKSALEKAAEEAA